IVRSELVFRAGTPPDARYSFKHALVQQAAYEGLPRSRRQALHATIAKALLPRDPGFADPQLDLMAWHCERGGIIEWAAALYARAGWRSASRGAFAEAHEQLANASRMVAAMPEGEARDRMELAIVPYFISVTRLHRGYANSEAAEAHRRAAELWERLGRPAEYLEVAHARYFFYFNRGELQRAQELALHLWGISQERADPRYRIMGHLLVGYSTMLRGDLMGAEAHLRDALTLIQSRSDDPTVPWRSSDSDAIASWVAWAMAHLTLGRVKCLLGHLDQARAHLSTVIDRAPPVGHEIAQVEFSAIQVRVSSYFTEAAELAPSVERLSKLTRELGVASFDAMATIHRGHVIACLGTPEEGISLMEKGIAAYAATEAVIWSGYHRARLSEAYQRLGRPREARQLLIEAQDCAERTGERWYDAELMRRMGEVDRQEGDVGAAERRFTQALAIAQRQHAKLWELHAATSLARLWHEQRRDAEARAVLAPVYGWFKEGLETGSLRRAKAVLEELKASLPLRPSGRRGPG
ncbi:MAG: tetratricopeptide repeat protein, partial [Acetobacteraceae bacterium]|nr:tetratricopeptide repeat protein [Acetobacteraceae bacterium]